MAVFALVGRSANEVRDARPLAGWLGIAALAALYAVPAVLIVLSRRERQGLLVVAGAVGIALIPTSMSITPLLIVPSVLVLLAPHRTPSQIVPVLAAVPLVILAFVVLLAWSAPACVSDQFGESCTSAAPTVGGALTSLGLSTLAVLTAFRMSRP